MRNVPFLRVVILLGAFAIAAQAAPPAEEAPDDPAPTGEQVQESSPAAKLPIVLPPRAQSAFGPGERLTFAIKYEFITAGTATLEVHDAEPVDGRPMYEIRSKAESNSFIDNFFKVRDFNSSGIDRASLASRRFHQNLREGHYRVVRTTHFDYEEGRYTYERTYKGKTAQRSGPISQPLQDMLSCFFYARTLKLEPGEEYAITVFSDEKVYPLKVRVHKKLQTIKTPAGTFECLRVEPQVIGDAIFKAKGGRMTIFMTNDEKKMPVLIRSKVFVGSFDAELSAYELGETPGAGALTPPGRFDKETSPG